MRPSLVAPWLYRQYAVSPQKGVTPVIYAFLKAARRCGNGTKVLRVDCLGTRRDQRGWDVVLDGTGAELGRYWAPGLLLAPERAETVGASEVPQGVCDTARTDRDGGCPCW